MDGWKDGWVEGWKSRVKDCLHQSKMCKLVILKQACAEKMHSKNFAENYGIMRSKLERNYMLRMKIC